MSYAIPSRARRRHSVSVVIPCYNYGRYLSGAVASAMNQSDVDVRVIIVDDCSTDDSLDVARGLAAADDRITVIAHETNAGHIRTYNDGLAAVTTEFVTLVSADDLVAEGALDRAAAAMERYPRVGLVFGKVATFSDELPPHARSFGRGLWRVESGRDWIEAIARRGFNPIMSPEAVLRTDLVRRIGGYNADLPHSADLEYWLQAAAYGDVVQIRGAVQAYYRVHGANMHLTQFAGSATDIAQKMRAFDILASPALASADARMPLLRDIAANTLADEADRAAQEFERLGDEARRVEMAGIADRIAPSRAVDDRRRARP